MNGMFSGTGTAMVTPFKKGKVDYAAFDLLLQMQLKNNIDAVIICGTTGEASTLTDTEKANLVSNAHETCKGRIPVIAGAGANDTRAAVKNARHMQKAGADAILCVTPYYNGCNQEGLKQHYLSVASAVEIPIILYNVPTRTGVNLEAETAAELLKHPNIRGIKEAAADFSKAARMISIAGSGAYVYSGNDNMLLSEMALGASGGISVLSNAVPALFKKITDGMLTGNLQAARDAHTQLTPLLEFMKKDVNPIPIKAVLAAMGLIQNELRLPLTPLNRESVREAEACLKRMAL